MGTWRNVGGISSYVDASLLTSPNPVYHTNESSDDITPADSFTPELHQAAVNVSALPRKSEALAGPVGTKDSLEQHSTELIFDDLAILPKPVPTVVAPNAKLKGLDDGAGINLRVSNATRSAAQLMDSSVFGASDEELSEISDDDSVILAPVTSRATRGRQRQELTKSRKSVQAQKLSVNRRILDSDDDLPQNTLPSRGTQDGKTVRKSTKPIRAVDVDSEDDAGDKLMPPVVSASNHPLAPVTPVKQLGRRAAPVTLGISEASSGLNDASNLTLPARARGVKSGNSKTRSAGVDIDSSSALTVSAQITGAQSVADASSRSCGFPEKAKKTDEKISHTSNRFPVTKVVDTMDTKKRGREDDYASPRSTGLPKTSPRPPKRHRGAEGPDNTVGILPETTESQVLRPRVTAATRATKKYRGKKGRTSSPLPTSPTAVDYDELPVSSTTFKVKRNAVAEKSSSPIGARSRVEAMKGKKPKVEGNSSGSKNVTKGKPKRLVANHQVKPAYAPTPSVPVIDITEDSPTNNSRGGRIISLKVLPPVSGVCLSCSFTLAYLTICIAAEGRRYSTGGSIYDGDV